MFQLELVVSLKKLLIPGLIFVVLISGCTQENPPTSDPQNGGQTPVLEEKAKFTVSQPEGSKETLLPSGSTYQLDKNSMVKVEVFEGPKNLDEIVAATINQYTEENNFEKVSEKDTTLDGSSAKEVILKYNLFGGEYDIFTNTTSKGLDYKDKVVVGFKNNKGFVLIYSSPEDDFDKNLAKADKIMQSFTIDTTATSNTADATVKPTNTLNVLKDIQVTVPDSWKSESRDEGRGILYYSPWEDDNDLYSENFAVNLEVLSTPITLEAYIAASIEYMKNSMNVNPEQKSTTLSNLPAYKLEFDNAKESDTGEQYTIRIVQIITIKNNKAYIITYGGEKDKFSQYESTFQSMVDSFKIL